MTADIPHLESLLNAAAKGLPDTTSKKMFGCHAMWAKGNVFALVWKHGRIGFKLPDTDTYQTLMAKPGAEPWKTGPMQMTHWVLVPESFHAKPTDLRKWATTAHRLCASLPTKAVKAKSPKTPKTAKKNTFRK